MRCSKDAEPSAAAMSMEGPPSYPPSASNPYSLAPVSSGRLVTARAECNRGVLNMSALPQSAPSVPAAARVDAKPTEDTGARLYGLLADGG